MIRRKCNVEGSCDFWTNDKALPPLNIGEKVTHFMKTFTCNKCKFEAKMPIPYKIN